MSSSIDSIYKINRDYKPLFHHNCVNCHIVVLQVLSII